MVWTREETQKQGKLRPYSVYHFAASLDADRKPEAWWNRVVSHSIYNHMFPRFMANGIDGQALEGLDRRLPYRFANQRVDYAIRDSHFPVQFWRSVGASQNAFALESFIDELAQAAGADPVEFRLSLLPADSPFRRPLEIAAKEAGWTTDLGRGEGMGVGLAEAFGTVVAQVARVTVGRRGHLRVESIDCAIDCGHVIHPKLVEMQVESSIVFGLTAALYGEVHIENRRRRGGQFRFVPHAAHGRDAGSPYSFRAFRRREVGRRGRARRPRRSLRRSPTRSSQRPASGSGGTRSATMTSPPEGRRFAP